MKFELFANQKKDVMPDSIKESFQRVLATEDGRNILRYLLFDWSYFSICNTPEQVAMRNYATKFLNELSNIFDVNVSAEIKIV
jgi:hypothetical protein